LGTLTILNTLVLLGAALVLVGIFSSLIAQRIGAPLLLVFLVIGMLAGEDGPGGILYFDFRTTYLVGSVALAIIVFDGGLRTRFSAFRGVLVPSVMLATVGVGITSVVMAFVTPLLFDIGRLEGLLLGTIVASTDAAAVFFLLRAGGLHLRQRVGATLEIEAGTNDPVAVFLVLVLIELIRAGGEPSWALVAHLGHHAVVGGAIGVAGGLAASWLLNRVDMPQGLHPLFVATAAVTIYAAATQLDGSGLLAAYLAGLVLGNRSLRAYSSIVSFHDALTWLCQIAMFVLLGLLVTPHELLRPAVPALGFALALMFIARPIAVLACLVPFGFRWREIAFISWVGLRGAVGIFLASMPVLVDLPNGPLYFNVAFFVVMISMLAQGWTVTWSARRLGVTLPRVPIAARRVELDLPGQLDVEIVGFPVEPDSPILHDATLPEWARPALVVRRNRILQPYEAGPPRAGDHIYLLAPPRRAPLLDRLFVPAPDATPGRAEHFGELLLAGDTSLSSLTALYGIAVPEEQTDLTLGELFAQAFDREPIVGDRVALGGVTFVARRVADDRVEQAALDLLAEIDAPAPPAGWRERVRRLFTRRRDQA
jgi:cell volume regulation protein A